MMRVQALPGVIESAAGHIRSVRQKGTHQGLGKWGAKGLQMWR